MIDVAMATRHEVARRSNRGYPYERKTGGEGIFVYNSGAKGATTKRNETNKGLRHASGKERVCVGGGGGGG